jgi:hypothetical protein
LRQETQIQKKVNKNLINTIKKSEIKQKNTENLIEIR